MIEDFFGATHDFEYNIRDKLYEFAIIPYKNFDKLKAMYIQLIELVYTAKKFCEDLEENPYTIELCNLLLLSILLAKRISSSFHTYLFLLLFLY